MLEIMNTTEPGERLWILIVAIGLLTYATRISGHIMISVFKTIPPKVHVALEAVPAAVLSALVAPAMFLNGPAEFITLAGVAVACLRINPAIVLFLALAALVMLRNVGL